MQLIYGYTKNLGTDMALFVLWNQDLGTFSYLNLDDAQIYWSILNVHFQQVLWCFNKRRCTCRFGYEYIPKCLVPDGYSDFYWNPRYPIIIFEGNSIFPWHLPVHHSTLH